MPDSFILSLVADLKPVRRLNNRDPWLVMSALCLAAIAAVAATIGLRADLIAGHPSDIVLLRSGVMLALGAASLAAVIAYARPGVGQQADGWIWAAGVAALFPAIAMLSAIEGQFPQWILTAPSGALCMGISLSIALVMGSALTVWVRRGASTRPMLQGWLIGLSSGAFATFSYSLHCESTTVTYAGFWYTGAILVSAGIGRLALPGLLRW